MNTITPCLWFDDQAQHATRFYTQLFDGDIADTTYYNEESAAVSGQPQGSVMTINFELYGKRMTALNGGPAFTFSPAISLFVSTTDIDRLWEALIEDGKALMEIGEYPFSKRYGWLVDKYGVSWQLNQADENTITPALLFVGEQFGNVRPAMQHYTDIFADSEIHEISEKDGAVEYASLSLSGNPLIAMESDLDHKFSFTQAISFVIECENQEEIDHYWDRLSDGGQIQECGWLVDKYGIAWQVVPENLDRLMQEPDKARRVMAALLKMKKLDMHTLTQA